MAINEDDVRGIAENFKAVERLGADPSDNNVKQAMFSREVLKYILSLADEYGIDRMQALTGANVAIAFQVAVQIEMSNAGDSSTKI